ncbi:hypothetical protein LSCM1_03615 [Leishmania martiniquensis]|uniref:AB hydrolase-1 domain-containing protein n=1 Tax=Leishmania martiniquensis TaxID=1580590 RepID=A0A836GYV7_9TRYP|nr:hypothetical protein LSCM1_03615 [Leishmania martiniquensis]
MSGGPSVSGTAVPLLSDAPFSAKVKFLFVQIFCFLVVDLVPRLARFLSGASFRTEKTAVHGSLKAKAFFKLNRVDQMPYVDPLYSGHTSTILCALRPHRRIPYTRVVHPGADGNPMCVDWLFTDARSAKGVFLIIPGLASWSGTNYIEHFVLFASTHHFHCAVFNSRGMGDTPLVTPRLMSGKWTDDLRAVLRDGPLSRAFIEKKCGADLPVIGVGFSLGGVILSKYVGEECLARRDLAMDAVMVVNSPLNCLDSSALMNRGISRVLYQPRMVGGLMAYARRHAKVLQNLPGLSPDVRAAIASGRLEDVLAQMKTVRDFDRFITAPTLGFATPEDYYHHISPTEWLPHISVPVLCISSADDPVTGKPPMASLSGIMASNPNVALVIIPRGGHLGYARSMRKEWAGTETAMEKIIYETAAVVSPRR